MRLEAAAVVALLLLGTATALPQAEAPEQSVDPPQADSCAFSNGSDSCPRRSRARAARRGPRPSRCSPRPTPRRRLRTAAAHRGRMVRRRLGAEQPRQARLPRSVWCARGRGSCLQDYPPHAHMPPPARERLSTGPQACLAPRRRRGAWLARPLADPAPRSVNALAPASSWRIIAARSRSRQRSRGRQAAALPGPVYSSRFKLNLVLSVRCHAPRCSCRLHPCP